MMRIHLGISHGFKRADGTIREDRVASMARLRAQLGTWPDEYREFSEVEPHPDWSKRMWTWGRDVCAGDPTAIALFLQDDVIVPENLYAILQALYSVWPSGIVNLIGAHPVARELARQGGRAYRSRAFLLGLGYSVSADIIPEFVAFRERNEQAARMRSEDSFLALFAVETGRDVLHPMPSLVEHDLSVSSTWSADNHGNRKAIISFRDYSNAEMQRADFWQHPGATRLITDHLGPRCWLCCDPAHPEIGEQAFMTWEPSGVAIGARCWARAGEFLGADVARRMAGG